MTEIDNSGVKAKIKFLVDEYKRLFPGEYASFLVGQKAKVKAQSNKFSSLKGLEFLERALLEYPATLFSVFQLRFNSGDWVYFDSKNGRRWFAREFPEFRLAEKI